MEFYAKNRLKNSSLILLGGLLLSLFSFNSSAQSYNNDGDSLFASSAIHTVYFNFYHTSFYDSLTASKISDEYYTCNMIVDGIQYDSVGGTHFPKHFGQSGQPIPLPVTRTKLPATTTR